MADIDQDEIPIEEEDPRVKRIVRRMRIFVAVSSAVMAIGFFTVISVIIWRVVKSEDRPIAVSPSATVEWSVPAGRIVAIAADGGRVFVTAEEESGLRIVHVLEAATLQPIGHIAESGAPPVSIPQPSGP